MPAAGRGGPPKGRRDKGLTGQARARRGRCRKIGTRPPHQRQEACRKRGAPMGSNPPAAANTSRPVRPFSHNAAEYSTTGVGGRHFAGPVPGAPAHSPRRHNGRCGLAPGLRATRCNHERSCRDDLAIRARQPRLAGLSGRGPCRLATDDRPSRKADGSGAQDPTFPSRSSPFFDSSARPPDRLLASRSAVRRNHTVADRPSRLIAASATARGARVSVEARRAALRAPKPAPAGDGQERRRPLLCSCRRPRGSVTPVHAPATP